MAHSELSKLLSSEDFTPGEKSLVMKQFRMEGGFMTKLWEAIGHADDGNLCRLRCGFPSEVDAFISWSRGDLADRIKKAGVDI